MARLGTPRKNMYWSLSILFVLVALAWLVFLSPKFLSSRTTEKARTAPTPPASEAAKLETEQSEHHTHEVPIALNFSNDTDFRQQQHWYDAAQLDAEGRYLPRATPIQLDQSCAHYKELNHRTLESAIQAELGLTLTVPTPDDVLIEEIAQFWQHDGFYFQISGRWDKDIPASYQANYFRSSSADFRSNVEHLPLPATATRPAPAGALDVIALGKYIDDVLAQAQKLGAKPGARLIHALPSGGDDTQDLKLNNGRVVSWMFGPGRCQLRTTGDAYCRCVADPNNPHETLDKESYRVID